MKLLLIVAVVCVSYLSTVHSLAAARVGKWPNNTIPYIKNTAHPFWSNIESKIKQINEKTSVKWVEKTNQATGYVIFTNQPGGNWANLGYHGVSAHTCNLSGNYRVIHEMLHIMGYIHEQNRSDRDNFIELNYKYLDKNNDWNKGNIINKVNDSINLTSYDIDSCMQYWCSAGGSKLEWYETINPFMDRYNNEHVTLYYKSDKGKRFGTNENLSRLDIEGINKHYSASFKASFVEVDSKEIKLKTSAHLK